MKIQKASYMLTLSLHPIIFTWMTWNWPLTAPALRSKDDRFVDEVTSRIKLVGFCLFVCLLKGLFFFIFKTKNYTNFSTNHLFFFFQAMIVYLQKLKINSLIKIAQPVRLISSPTEGEEPLLKIKRNLILRLHFWRSRQCGVTSSLPLLPGPLWLAVSDRVPSLGQSGLFKNHLHSIEPWTKKVFGTTTPKMLLWRNNERDSRTTWHKITLDGLTCR